MQIIEKKSPLSHFCCCCHQQLQRCSQPHAGGGRSLRVSQTPSCVPNSLWIPVQLQQSQKTAMELRETEKPIANPAFIGPQKGCGCFMNCVRSYQGRGASPWVTKMMHSPKLRIPSQEMCLSYILCVFITQILHVSGYKLLKCIIKCSHSQKTKSICCC